MQAIKHIIKTPRNHSVQIPIPISVPENESVEIIVMLKEHNGDFERKILETKNISSNYLDEDDPIYDLAKDPVDCGVTDASENLDKYLYDLER